MNRRGRLAAYMYGSAVGLSFDAAMGVEWPWLIGIGAMLFVTFVALELAIGK